MRGPAKSSPVYVNGGDTLTLKSGNAGADIWRYGVGLSLYPSTDNTPVNQLPH